MRVCSACGAPLDDADRFCTACGARVESPGAPAWPVQEPARPSGAPSAAPARRRPVALIVALVCVLAIAAAAIGAIVVISAGGGGDDAPRLVAPTTTQGEAATVDPAAEEAETDDSADDAAADDDAADDEPSATARYTADVFEARPPAGWDLIADQVDHGSYVESKWQAPEPGVTLLVDYTDPYTGTARSGADAVHAATSRGAGYREFAYEPVSLGDTEAWRWSFSVLSDGVRSRRVDYFITACGVGFGILGSAPPAAFERYRDTFEAFAASVVARTC